VASDGFAHGEIDMKSIVARIAAVALSLGAAASAHAGGNVFWSIGINAPLDPYGTTIGTTISNAPSYLAAPVYVQPAPIYYPPAPVVYAPPVYVQPHPVYMQPRPVYVQPRPVVVYPRPVHIAAPVWSPPRHRWHDRGHDGYRDGYRDGWRGR
jgi:hypothetical protein